MSKEHLLTLFFTDNSWHEDDTGREAYQPFAVFQFKGTNATAEAVMSAIERAVAGWVAECAEGSALAKRSQDSLDLWWIEPELSGRDSKLQPYLKRQGVNEVTRILWVGEAVHIPMDHAFWDTQDIA